ncbi:sporulation histidine kinase inhibitor Sda [Falsibacillus albus]|uniref:Sporulation histidine kinase inhibitor Sda n=1 Tax=Falsibacillus albus TaxID=2478915 RepID=A0A3L7JYB3_9BACI|nr:sporulation histidine kinase inhibitor Sda [Falsibacillus albus]RLQ93432.1 sporulation histidine kinase inhibitor Sda [Falsibacillus albus]
MNSIYLLSDSQLLKAYKQAKKERLSDEFIRILEKEINKRDLDIKQDGQPES